LREASAVEHEVPGSALVFASEEPMGEPAQGFARQLMGCEGIGEDAAVQVQEGGVLLPDLQKGLPVPCLEAQDGFFRFGEAVLVATAGHQLSPTAARAMQAASQA